MTRLTAYVAPEGKPPSTQREVTTLAGPLLKPADAALLLNVKPSWIYEAVRVRKLPHL
jgi:hypothetical protein